MSESQPPADGGNKPTAKGHRKSSSPRTSGTATRRRKNLSGRAQGRQISRPLLIALLVIVAGGSYLFWPRGGDVPLGIGEQYSVVTADTTLTSQPRSGSVDLGDQQRDLVPEEPAGATTPARDLIDLRDEDSGSPASGADSTPPTQPSTRQPEPEAPPRQPQQASIPPAADEPEPIVPRERGPWALQLGAYRTEANANRSVDALAEKGVTAHARAASTSSGDIIFRVWVGWFDSRAEALAYAKQEKRRIGDAYPVHR